MHVYGIPTLTKLASSNIWSNLSQIYGQTQICGQIVAYIWSKPNIWSNLYDQTQIHGQTKVIVIFPIYGQT